MNIRWLFGNYADPEYRLSRSEQWALSDAAHKKHTSRQAFVLWTVFVVVLPTLLVIKFVLPLVLTQLGFAGQTGPYMIGLAVIILLFWFWSAWLYRFLYAGPIRLAMRARGMDVCVGCGYRLEGLADTSTKCPECGAEREPAGPSDPAA